MASSTLLSRTVTHLLPAVVLKIYSADLLMLLVFWVFFFFVSSGTHSVQVLYDDTPVPKSPFRVSVTDGCNPRRVVASGPGLEQALTNKPNNFNIVTRYCCLSEAKRQIHRVKLGLLH